MHNYFEDGLNFIWLLVRETRDSQKFSVTIIDDGKESEAICDIHYTRPNTATASILFIRGSGFITDVKCGMFFADLAMIIKRSEGYELIDFTLAHTTWVRTGSYAIEKKSHDFYI